MKDALVEKTGGGIDFFLSSDGQSIPLGRNWVHRIEEALETAHLMFVFVSPQSVHTHWIYFEAGYVYHKNIRVVPVGILGTDLSSLSAPISLLQGFNIRSADSLNNIIAVLNEMFPADYQSFTTDDYELIFGAPIDEKGSAWGLLAAYVDSVHLTFKFEFDHVAKVARSVLEHCEIPYQMDDSSIRFAGASLSAVTHQRTTRVSAELEPTMFPVNLPILKLIEIELQPAAEAPAHVDVYFYPNVDLVSDDSKVTARLHGSAIQFGGARRLKYKTLEFEFDFHSYARNSQSQVFLRLHNILQEISEVDLANLLNLLINRNILLIDD